MGRNARVPLERISVADTPLLLECVPFDVPFWRKSVSFDASHWHAEAASQCLGAVDSPLAPTESL